MTVLPGPAAPPRIGLSITAAFLRGGTTEVRDVIGAADEGGLDYLQIGDHVSFHDGTGFDGLVHAAAALAVQDRMPVQVGLYLLALRHPVLVARQLTDLARMAPGRITLGVGVGGEDRHEFEVAGIDPATRGKRTDEALDVLRELMTGRPTTAHGRFFDLDDALVTPAPRPPVRIVVGGRSDAALRRAGRYGDGWLALWSSPERFGQAIGLVAEAARDAGRPDVDWVHGLNLWCGLDIDGVDGRATLAAAMEERYKLPFARFERWCPTGSADDIATMIVRYARLGCRQVTVVLHHPDLVGAAHGVADIRRQVHAQYLAGAVA